MRLHHQMTLAQRKTITTTADGAVAVLIPLSGVEVTYFVGGSYDAGTDTGTLATIYQSSDLSSNVTGPAPEAGASGGPNPYTTGITGLAETWLAPSLTGYDIRIRDTTAPARIPTRTILRWGFAPNAGIATGALTADGGLTLAHIGADILRQDVPIGGCIPWFRPASSVPVPAGFVISDGTSVAAGNHDFPGIAGAINTLDLRNKFILGADVTKTDATAAVGDDLATSGPGIRGGGGSHAVALTAAQIPAHTHPITDPGHSHTLQGANNLSSGGGGYHAQLIGQPVNWNDVSPGTDGSGTGITVNANTGGGGSHNNMPGYAGLLYIMKVKRA